MEQKKGEMGRADKKMGAWLVPAKKIKLEVYDESGNRYTITFEGRVTREKALHILDVVELLGGMPGVEPPAEYSAEPSKIDMPNVKSVRKRRYKGEYERSRRA